MGAGLDGAQGVLHLATRIPPPDSQGDPEASGENDRLRRNATRTPVDVAFATGVELFTFPSIAFVYPSSGPGRGSETPAKRYASFGATLRIEDAGRALAASLAAPSGTYNVVGDDERVSNTRFNKAATHWPPSPGEISRPGPILSRALRLPDVSNSHERFGPVGDAVQTVRRAVRPTPDFGPN